MAILTVRSAESEVLRGDHTGNHHSPIRSVSVECAGSSQFEGDLYVTEAA